MNEFLEVTAEVCMHDVLHAMSDMFVDDLVGHIKHLDQLMADPDFTQQMAEYFAAQVEDME
jgi:hypothetical protein